VGKGGKETAKVRKTFENVRMFTRKRVTFVEDWGMTPNSQTGNSYKNNNIPKECKGYSNHNRRGDNAKDSKKEKRLVSYSRKHPTH